MQRAINLTEGVMEKLSNGLELKPVLQVVDVKLLNSNDERYRISLSDGLFLLPGILATQNNPLIKSLMIRKGSIIRLNCFVCNVFQNRLIIIIIDLDILLETCDPIGEPTLYLPRADGSTPSLPRPAAPLQPSTNNQQNKKAHFTPLSYSVSLENHCNFAGKMQLINLTEGWIKLQSNGEDQVELKPVLQVVDIKLVNSNNERYWILLSDGLFLQQGILATQKNELIKSQVIQKGSIIQLNHFVCNVIQNRRLIIIIDLGILLERCDPIGEPTLYLPSAHGSTPSVTRPAAPLQPSTNQSGATSSATSGSAPRPNMPRGMQSP